MRINYLSYGIINTGGFYHEKCLFDTLTSYYGNEAELKLIRKNKLYKHFFDYIKLLVFGFVNSNAKINLVVSRIAFSAILRNLFTQNEVWVVLHNFDNSDAKSKLMKIYYAFLFKILRRVKHNRFKIIVVADYWVTYFNKTLGLKNVHIFPNFLDLEKYSHYSKEPNSKKIHLGQFSTKNDKAIFELAEKLTKQNYDCFFTTLNKNEILKTTNYSILYFGAFEAYLQAIADCKCTLALTNINEGWNRVAHESILLKTPVIGYNKGGLGNLLTDSNSNIISSTDEVFKIIIDNNFSVIDSDFIEKYSTINAKKYLMEICKSL
ncbi:MAG: hypothetical protein HQ463_08375 [Bacteroidetes bacterium]|nr:hypothetical protein [Bacteroidota bacterium]